MKRKVDLLAVALARQSSGPWDAGHVEKEAIPMDSSQHSQNGLTLERN
jgi:hypothetical protein